MYGLVNKAVEGLICELYDRDTWDKIKEKAGLEELDFFNSMEAYSDDITYNLVGAASEILELTPEEILFAFGEHWVTYTAKEGYGDLLSMAGNTLPEFLSNLNNLHVRVGMSFPELKPPSFEVKDLTNNSLVLHYISKRDGLAPMIGGLIFGLGKRFGIDVKTTQITSKNNEDNSHDTFFIEWN